MILYVIDMFMEAFFSYDEWLKGMVSPPLFHGNENMGGCLGQYGKGFTWIHMVAEAA